jgi:superfamily II DNA or RNA helicase
VIVDGFHHAAAASYERLLERVQPVESLGLTATPERSDGLPILHWFGDRIAAELRLWDAIDQHRLVWTFEKSPGGAGRGTTSWG